MKVQLLFCAKVSVYAFNIAGTNPGTAKILNGLSGSWYDPAYDGSGFNLIQANGGKFLLYFYGYKDSANGDAQWLLSETIDSPVKKGQTLTAKVLSGSLGNGGSFTTKPNASSSGLSNWGKVQVTMTSCSSGFVQLHGKDGTIVHNIKPVAPINGLSCTESDAGSTRYTAPNTAAGVVSGFSGSWYDPTYDGSGFNLIQTGGGTLIYFYGYRGNTSGDAQWLLSELISDPIQKNQLITAKVFSGFASNGGSFTTKPTTPQNGLTEWGTAQLTISGCGGGVLQLIGDDGTITHNIIPLVTIDGVTCSE